MNVLILDAEEAHRLYLAKALSDLPGTEEVLPFAAPAQTRNNGACADAAFLVLRENAEELARFARALQKKNPQINLIFLAEEMNFAPVLLSLHASGFLPLYPSAAVLREEVALFRFPLSEKKIRVKAFGNFEVFAGGIPVHFHREKAKELLALLIDRQGASLTTEQMAAILWEDRNYTPSLKSQLTGIISCLRKDLRAVGAEEILIKTWGHLAVDQSRVACDAWDWIAKKPEARKLFLGEYMSQYYWAEERVGEFNR